MNPFPSLPWYTWITLLALVIVLAGIGWSLCMAIARVTGMLFHSVATAVVIACIKATGWRLTSHGTAHWAGWFERRRAGIWKADGIPLGTIHGHILREPRGGHVALFGPPRSRKSWGLIMPAIESFPGSLVVSDLRGELYRHTHEKREECGRVFRFDPANRNDSCSLNVLDAVRWRTEYQFGDIMRIVSHLLAPQERSGGNDFRIAAIPLLTSIIVDRYNHEEGNFPSVVEWMLSPDRTLTEKLSHLLTSSDPLVQAGARRTLDQSERLRASVWNSALSPLTVFQDETVASHSRTSDVHFDQLLSAVNPVCLYLCFSFGDIARLGVLLGAMVETLVALLGTPRTTPRHKILMCLDEVANMGRLSELERALSFLQGSGTQVLLAFQNLQQVIAVYGHESPMLASVGTQVFYTPTDMVTARAISDRLGEATSTTRSYTTSERTSETQSAMARSLLTPDEVLRVPETDAIIFLQGQPPLYARKLGVPPRQPVMIRVHDAVKAHRWGLATASVCLALALALWPLIPHSPRPTPVVLEAAVSPTTPPVLEAAVSPTTPTTVKPLVTPTLLPGSTASMMWELHEVRDLDRKGAKFFKRLFPTLETCQAAIPYLPNQDNPVTGRVLSPEASKGFCTYNNQ